MKKNNIYACIILLACVVSVRAQVLSPQDAIAEALKKNYNIQLQRNTTQQSKNDVTWGNAGLAPQVNLNAGGTYSSNDTKQEFLNGTKLDRKGAISSGVNSGLALNWVLFDGMAMFAAHDRLKEQYKLSETVLKTQIENTVTDVLNTYYDLVKQRQLIKATENAIALYEERMKIAETKWNIGSASKLDFLQAKVDLNEQRSILLNLKNAFNTSRINMNTFLGRSAETLFDVADSIPISFNLTYDELKKTAQTQNTELIASRKNIRVNELLLKETRSLLFPRVALTSNYAFARTENQAGFVLLNQNLGFNAGLTASWNIFSGGNTRRLIKNSELDVMNSKLQFESLRVSVEAELLSAYNDFVNAKEILKLEEENFLAAKENAEVALEAFRLGTTGTIEVKQAQQSFDDAQVRLVNARYVAKVAETQLMKLNGALVK